AEDGIRDFHVTGVQTCALPISWRGVGSASPAAIEALERLAWIADSEALELFESAVTKGVRPARAALLGVMRVLAEQDRPDQVVKIGRASCRGRVEMGVGEGWVR